MYSLDYGIIGNCQTGALISKQGSIDWLCFPAFDSPSIFSRILDNDKGGCFAFGVSAAYSTFQKYIQNTNILCTQFISAEGSFEVLDFMPRYHTMEGDHYFPAEIYRYIRLMHGKPRFNILYDPRMNYAQEDVVHRKHGDFIKTYSIEDGQDNIYLYSDLDYDKILSGDEFLLEKDEYLLLSYNQKLVSIDIDRVYLEYQRTKVYWLNWNNRSKKLALYNDMISRSLLTLKLMSYQDTGAVVAALTTSIPEAIGEQRNWDYRFCWIRDASMSIETILKMGHKGAAQRYMRFVKRIMRSRSDTFQIMYGLHGERELEEKTLPHLSGFEDTKPVRIGNGAHNQRQNDSLGYLMDVIYCYYTNFPGSLDDVEEMWELMKSIVRMVYMDWRKKDKSIWEIRGEEKHYVFSKIMCWVAIDRAVKVARILGRDYFAEVWQKEAELIKEDILEHGWNDKLSSFTQSYDNDDADSSVLLMEYYGFLAADDERFIRTVEYTKSQLFNNGLMYRYRNDDGFGMTTSAFTMCTFWLVRALHVTGNGQEAREIFDELISYSNHLGLFSEDLDFDTKRMLGNFPQAYSHLALINTAMLFSEEKTYSKFIRP